MTLEATPKIAEKIAVAQTIGQLSLSLRSIADNAAELERAIASGEVEVPESDDPKAERQMLLAIASKPADSNTTYTVGADVSRFQRSTVPGTSRSTGTRRWRSLRAAAQALRSPTFRRARSSGSHAATMSRSFRWEAS